MANSPSDSGGTVSDTSIYVPANATGGSGTGGQYVFADLTELDAIITTLQTEIEGVRDDARYFRDAIRQATAPAGDLMSQRQVNAYRAALEKGGEHNKAVLTYLENQLAKLQAAHQSYAETEAASVKRFHGTGEEIP